MVDSVMVFDKKLLEIVLEETPVYSHPKEFLEQYITPTEVASKLLWEAFLRGDISGKTIADLGCGTLRLGFGALFLGASRVVGVDVDVDALADIVKWVRGKPYSYRVLLVQADVRRIVLYNIDTVVMNPPFGVKKCNRGLDMVFLKKALGFSNSVYTIHKASVGGRRLVKNIVDSLGYSIVYSEETVFPIKMVYPRHRRRVYRVVVDMYGFRRLRESG